MLTVSFVNELQFVAKHFNVPLSVDLKLGKGEPVKLVLVNDVLTVEYLGELIWKEKVAGPDSNFGVESCEVIFKLIKMTDAGDYSWQDKIPHIFA